MGDRDAVRVVEHRREILLVARRLTGVGQADLLEYGDCVERTLRTTVVTVVGGKGATVVTDVECRLGECPRRAESRIAAQIGVVDGDRGLEMTDRKVGALDNRPDLLVERREIPSLVDERGTGPLDRAVRQEVAGEGEAGRSRRRQRRGRRGGRGRARRGGRRRRRRSDLGGGLDISTGLGIGAGGAEDRHACDEKDDSSEHTDDSQHHRNSSGATGQSIRNLASAAGTGPPGPTTRSTRSSDTTS